MLQRGEGEEVAKTVLADDNTAKKKGDEEPELSEEDQKKKEEFESMVERIKEVGDAAVQANALAMLKEEIRTSTGSMTAVPKALKFVGPFYQEIKDAYANTCDANKKTVADLLSYLGTIHGAEAACECLHYKLEGSLDDLDVWGHEFSRHLCAEISAEYNSFSEEGKDTSHLTPVVDMVLPYLFLHNSEPEAVDLLMDIEQVERLVEFADETNYKRLCNYLLQCSNYVPEPEDNQYRQVVADIFQKLNQPGDALRVAMAMQDLTLVNKIFEECEEETAKKQLAYMIAESHIHIETEEEELEEIIGNGMLTDNFLALARDLDVMEAKTPEDIYKTHLSSGRSNAPDSARQNLANTFVNGFVNAGYGQDKLLSSEGANKWFYRNQEHGMMSAAASLGMIHLWDVTTGLNSIINYLKASDDYIKAGALMGIGIVSAGVRSECDPVFALIDEELNKDGCSDIMKTGGIVGIGIAYAGTNEESVQDLLLPIVEDPEAPIELVSLAALSLGLVFVGNTAAQIAEAILKVLTTRGEDSTFKHNTLTRFLCLGLGLLYLGKQEEMEATLEAVKELANKSLSMYAANTLVSCAYAGTGNVLQVQKLLHLAGQHPAEKPEEDEGAGAEAEGAAAENAEDMAHQTVAPMGLALVAFGEEIGSEMAIRTCDHMLQYGEPAVRRGVPLALALLSVSNPDLKVTETLSKLSHDADVPTAQCAILALGLASAGTNNARIAATLRQLAAFYQKDAQMLFMVNMAQGLLHMGKGLLSLSPFHSDRLLKSTTALSGILAVLHAAVDIKGTLLSKHHYLMYFLVSAIKPNMLITIDAEGNQLPVSVRVGKAVDTVGQAGKPKTITGFQTYTTPVLIGYGERAELATDEYIPVSNTLEGIVILKVNPDSKDAKEKEEAKSKKKTGPVYSSRADLTW